MQCGLRIGEVFALKNVQEKYLENEQVVHGILRAFVRKVVQISRVTGKILNAVRYFLES